MQEYLDLVRVLLAISIFSFASVSDWRTRRVNDAAWIILGSLAILLLWIDLLDENSSLLAHSILLPIAFIFFDVFWDKEKLPRSLKFASPILYLVSFIWIAYIGYTLYIGESQWDSPIRGPFLAFIMILVFELFYISDVIKGGADAKGVICLAILFPSYPVFSNVIPLISTQIEIAQTLFNFSISALFLAAIISLLVPVYFLFRNLKSKDRLSTRSFIGFKLPIDEVEKHPVWLIEWIENGKLIFRARKPRDSATLEDDLEALRSIGRESVWVTYKIPFIMLLFSAIIIIVIIGNPFFLLF